MRQINRLVVLVLLVCSRLAQGATSPADSARVTPNWRLGALLGTNLQRFVSGSSSQLPASVEQRLRPGLNMGMVGSWMGTRGRFGARLEASLTYASHQWQQADAHTDLRYRGRLIGVAPLLDVALLRSRRLHLLVGVQVDAWLPSSRITGQAFTGTFFSPSGPLVPVYLTKTDQQFHPGSDHPFRLLLGTAWTVRTRLEIGLRLERGEQYVVQFQEQVGYSWYSRPMPVRIQAARLTAVWWLR